VLKFGYGVAALYLVAIATAASLVGQHLVRKVVAVLGRASVIIFILTFTLCVSAVLLGKCKMILFAECIRAVLLDKCKMVLFGGRWSGNYTHDSKD